MHARRGKPHRRRRWRRRPCHVGDLIKLLVEPADQFGELVGLSMALLGRVGGRSRAHERSDALCDIVEALVDRFELVAVPVIHVRRAVNAFLIGPLYGGGVEPFAEGDTQAAYGLLLLLARFRPYAFDTPRDAKVHRARTHSKGGGEGAFMALRGSGTR